MATQYAQQPNFGSDELHRYYSQYQLPSTTTHYNTDANVGIPGLLPAETSRGMVVPPPSAYAPSVYTPSTAPQELGFHTVDYTGGSNASMQFYPYTQANNGVVGNAEASLHSASAPQDYLRQNPNMVPSTESSFMPHSFAGQRQVTGYSTSGGSSFSQGNYMEDGRSLATIHDYGNGYISHQQHSVPHFQTTYQNSGLLVPFSLHTQTRAVDTNLSTVALHPQAGTLDTETQRLGIEQQNNLNLELQQPNYQYFQQQRKNLRHPSANTPFKIRRGSNSSAVDFRKLRMAKTPKPPQAAGPGSPGWCNVCLADCNTPSILQQHITGKKHQKKLQQLERVDKDVAQQKSAIQNFNQVTGPLEAANLTDDTELSVEPSKESQPKMPPSFIRCELCNVTCNSKFVLEYHLNGRKHAAKLKTLPEEIRSKYKSMHHKAEGDQIQKLTM